MILQELVSFYNRLLENPEIDICEPGFSEENISFKIVINENGEFKYLEDLRILEGKNARPVKMKVPKFDGKRTSGSKPYFLWDKSDYTVGYALKQNKQTKEMEEVKKENHHSDFIELLDLVSKESGIENNVVLKAVRKFCTSQTEIEKLKNSDSWEDFLGEFTVFEVENYGYTTFENEEISEAWKKYYANQSNDENKTGYCMVIGEELRLARLHPTIKKGVGGHNDTPLISCNIDSGESYGKENNLNAPISSIGASYFTGALNYLVNNNRYNIKIADTLTVFWAENNSDAVTVFGGMYDSNKTDDDGYSQELEAFLKNIEKGRLPDELKDESRFFVLGLAPNSGRISVRFWYADTVKEMALKISDHFNDLRIIPENKQWNKPNPSIWRLLIETVPNRDGEKRKIENIPKNIVGNLMRSILYGSQYPKNILSILQSRIRVDKRINYYRAAFIKAILNRNFNKKITMSLDTNRKTSPYSLGRLFAVLEKTQEDSSGGKLNSTIKDRYFSSAAATPKVVFPIIIKLAQNHLKKMKSDENKKHFVVSKEKLICKIMDNISDFPKTLKLEDQGEFSIGYYHQRQNFFKKNTEKTKINSEGVQ